MVWLLLFLLISLTYWPPIFIFISKYETSDNFSVSKFGSVFFTLTRGTSLQSLFLRVPSLSFRFFSCSSVHSLLGPKNHGRSQKGASLKDKWSFHHYSPTFPNRRVPVKLISILIKGKVIRIPESRKFSLVESGILGIGIQNPAFGIQNPAKEWMQNPFAENPFQIELTAFMRIHATVLMLKRRLQIVQTTQTVQTM